MKISTRSQATEDVRQDLRAMYRARNWDAVDSIRRAMQGLGRWSPKAQEIFEHKCQQFGHRATDHQERQ